MNGKRPRDELTDPQLNSGPSPSVPSFPPPLVGVTATAASSTAEGKRNERYERLLRTREQLPIFAKRDAIIQTVLASPVTILVGETGSGKTTQVPHFLGEMRTSFPGIVACTQPRRIAAISVAARVAEEMDVELGGEVGYHVRFQSMKRDDTHVLYLTDGMLLREAFSDPDLNRYSVVVVDEAHERTVDTDVLLGLLKQLVARRPSFRLVVMSATLDISKITGFFPSAPLVTVSGRMYDVLVQYAPQPVKDYVEAAVARVIRTHHEEPVGDILCFLTGEAEVERAVAATKAAVLLVGEGIPATSGSPPPPPHAQEPGGDGDKSLAKPPFAVVLPLFGSLNLADQQKVFQAYPANTRKIVFSTNIAETSVTIDGIVYVIDSGFQKQSLYSSQARVDYLLPAVISKASAEQRKGRAGRTRPGKCFRLFTESDFASFPDQSHPEILRTNVVNTVLLLLKLGVTNVLTFPFLDTPSDESLADAFYQLTYFEAVDDELQLTSFGKDMADFPVDACLSRMLLKAPTFGCAGDAAVMAAMLEVGNLFIRPPSRGKEADHAHEALGHPDGDHVTRFLLFHAYLRSTSGADANPVKFCRTHFLRLQALQQAVQVYHQLRRLMGQHNVPIVSTYDAARHTVDTVALRKAVLSGFFTQVAYRAPGSVDAVYRTVRDAMPIQLHRQSVLCPLGGNKFRRKLPTWLMYDRLEVQGAEGTFARVGSPIEVDWLLDASDYYVHLTEIPDGAIAYALKQASTARQS